MITESKFEARRAIISYIISLVLSGLSILANDNGNHITFILLIIPSILICARGITLTYISICGTTFYLFLSKKSKCYCKSLSDENNLFRFHICFLEIERNKASEDLRDFKFHAHMSDFDPPILEFIIKNYKEQLLSNYIVYKVEGEGSNYWSYILLDKVILKFKMELKKKY